MTLRTYQRPTLVRIHEAITAERGGTYTVMFPRQSGKNELAATLVGGLLVAHSRAGGSMVVCAPTFTPQALISLHRASDLFRRLANIAGGFRIERNTIRCGKATAFYLGASPEANVAGHTASIAIIADEAQDIDADWFDRQFRPMAASTGAPTVMFGTPWNGRTLLEKAVDYNRRVYPPRNHRVTWEQVAAELREYGAYVMEERARLGAGHHLFRTQYDLVAGQPHKAFLTSARLAMLQGRHQRLSAPVPGERYVGGLDVGGSGLRPDATVLTIGRVVARRLEVVEHRAWHGATFGRLTGELREMQSHWRLGTLHVDATGIGSGLVGELRHEPLPMVPFNFNRGSKSSLGSALLAAIETGRLALYADDGSPEYATCLDELQTCTMELLPGGQIAWGNDRGHDDYVASLALCLHAASTLGEPRVARGRSRAS